MSESFKSFTGVYQEHVQTNVFDDTTRTVRVLQALNLFKKVTLIFDKAEEHLPKNGDQIWVEGEHTDIGLGPLLAVKTWRPLSETNKSITDSLPSFETAQKQKCFCH